MINKNSLRYWYIKIRDLDMVKLFVIIRIGQRMLSCILLLKIGKKY